MAMFIVHGFWSISVAISLILYVQETFRTYDEIIDHLDTNHNYKATYTCPFCDEDEFETQSKLNRSADFFSVPKSWCWFFSLSSNYFSSLMFAKSFSVIFPFFSFFTFFRKFFPDFLFLGRIYILHPWTVFTFSRVDKIKWHLKLPREQFIYYY